MAKLAIEVSTFEAGDAKVLRARTIGQTQAARAVKRKRARYSWDRGSWLEALRQSEGGGGEAERIARSLMAFRDRRGLEETYGTGKAAAVQIGIRRDDAYCFPFLIYNDGGVEVGFHWMKSMPYPPFHRLEKREELFTKLNAIEGIDLPADRPRPGFRLEALADEVTYQQFEEVFEWALNEAEQSKIGTANLDDARQEMEAESAS